VVADGHVPTYSTTPIDPRAGPAVFTLRPHDLDRRDPERVFRGRVLDDTGRPVEGARVIPIAVRRGNSTQYGGLTGFDALAVTNAEGVFQLGVAQKGDGVAVRVFARALAPSCFDPQSAGATVHEFRLGPGVTISGRVLINGKPLTAAPLGLVENTRATSKFVGDFKISTDSDGYFQFVNVPPNETYALYGLMDGFPQDGAIPVQEFRVGDHSTSKDVGRVAVQRAHRLSGRVVLADGKPVPEGTRLLLARERAWDTQSTVVSKDGTFTFAGLPAERYSLIVNVPGYHASLKNASLHPLHRDQLVGKVEADIRDLRFLLEPGALERLDFSNLKPEDYRKADNLVNGPLRGAPAEAADKE